MRSGLALAAMVMATAAQAGTFWDGNKLYSKLRGETMEQMQALGYIMGVSDAMDTVTVCSPTTVTAGQVLDIMKQYLESIPTVRHLPADTLISVVLGRVWPCDKKKGNAL